MTHTWKDTVATALVAVVVVIYLAYLSFDGIPFVRDVRGMAALGLALSIASRRIGSREGFTHPRVAMAANFGSIALGVVALVTELPAVLAAFIVSIIALWLAATVAGREAFGHRRLHPSP